MKNAKLYEKRIKKLLSGVEKQRPSADGPPDPVRVLVEAVFNFDATPKQATAAIATIDDEFVDFNELRVSPPRDLIGIVGKDYPKIIERARQVVEVLNRIYQRTGGAVSMTYMEGMAKRELRKHLGEIGLNAYGAADVSLRAFGGHAIPVDQLLVDCLIMEGCVNPDTNIEDVQGFLERVVPAKDAVSTHHFLREHVEGQVKRIAKWRQENAIPEEKEDLSSIQDEDELGEEEAAVAPVAPAAPKPAKPEKKAAEKTGAKPAKKAPAKPKKAPATKAKAAKAKSPRKTAKK